ALPTRFDLRERPRERHVAVAMMVTVRLSVGGDVTQRRLAALNVTAIDHARDDLVTVGEQALERDRLRRGPVVEEQIDRASRRELALVRATRIDRRRAP